MRKDVKREDFISLVFLNEVKNSQGYKDTRIPIGFGQEATKPSVVHRMVDLLVSDLKCFDSVLEIGTGSGYQTAILAEIFNEVVTIEYFQPLMKRAQQALQGYSNITFINGNGMLGMDRHFDGIIAGTCLPKCPETYNASVMVLPIGNAKSQYLYKIKDSKYTKYEPCGFCLAQEE